ncbi:MAG: peptidylprolyl isomerase [Deltaproteobacteria bacterium]|nr:peptidylprolyl isomerase [Deltaproteobacteria bacterium]
MPPVKIMAARVCVVKEIIFNFSMLQKINRLWFNNSREDEKMKKILVAVLLVISGLSIMNSHAGDDVVARIGKKKNISLADFKRWLGYNSEENRKALEKDPKRREMLLRQIVTSMVIADQAKKEGFDKRADVKENMKLLIDNFLTLEYLDMEVARKVKVDEEEINRYYEENKSKFEMPERIKASHILIQVKKTASENEQKEARARMEKVLQRARAGEDFARLAAEFSDDPGSKQRGGDLGFFSKGKMAPEFEKAAFALKPGEMSDIVQTNFGFHIIRLDERKEPFVQPVTAVREQLLQTLTLEKKRKAVDEYVEKMVKAADVEFFHDNFFDSSADPHQQVK